MSQGRKNPELHRYSLRLFREDVDAIQSLYPNLTYNEAIRNIVHRHVRKVQKARRELDDRGTRSEHEL